VVVEMHTAKLFFVVILFLFLGSFCFFAMAATDQQTAFSALNRAEQATVSAFQAVFKAEIIGGNVSDLLAQMNVAGMYMTKAQVAFGFENYHETVSQASQCYGISSTVESQANSLRIEVGIRDNADAVVRIVVSAISITVVCIVSFLAWRGFKRNYHRRFLKMKLEVSSDES